MSRAPSGLVVPSISPRQPCRMPTTSSPRSSARRVTARITAFRPGQSPPPVRMPIRIVAMLAPGSALIIGNAWARFAYSLPAGPKWRNR